MKKETLIESFNSINENIKEGDIITTLSITKEVLISINEELKNINLDYSKLEISMNKLNQEGNFNLSEINDLTNSYFEAIEDEDVITRMVTISSLTNELKKVSNDTQFDFDLIIKSSKIKSSSSEKFEKSVTEEKTTPVVEESKVETIIEEPKVESEPVIEESQDEAIAEEKTTPVVEESKKVEKKTTTKTNKVTDPKKVEKKTTTQATNKANKKVDELEY